MAQWSKQVFADNLRKYMDRSGKSQKDLAEVAGVSTATFSDWVNGKKYPRIDRIEMLANYFGILKSDLIEEKPTDPKVDELSKARQDLMQTVLDCPEEDLDRLRTIIQLFLSGNR